MSVGASAAASAGGGTARTTGRPAGAPSSGGVSVRVRLFAGAAAAAGTEEDTLEVTPARAGDVPVVADLRRALAVRHPGLGPVLEVATVLVGEVAAGPDDPVLPSGSTDGPAPVVDVLPPFAGG
ncbi:MoaD/ThiS family protein [Pseudokineococcus sp. 1T1Z-3]|uniref:MoaD/ThiS family protein n=1 Tax=Pseudokineococcus sp. 1T1Z-3 TaxID=3132745 RepID=UPI0030983004